MKEKRKRTLVSTEEKHNQDDREIASPMYAGLMVFVHPDPSTYLQGVMCTRNTTDTRSDAILEDILRRFAGAWRRLSET